MESQLELLKSEFSIVKENTCKISSNYNSIKDKIGKLKHLYSEMISTNSHKKIFLFCLESFNFQIKAFNVDTENIQNSLLLITNRIYCDYYKLFKLISSLFDEYKYKLPESIKERPVYNDLNPFAEYKLEDVTNLHDDVCSLILSLIMTHNSNQMKIDSYTSKSQTGICILNFIKTLEYDNSVLKDQIMLYLNYMDFFKNTQTKHLTKLLKKMEALKTEIDEEIVFDADPDTDTDSSSSDGDTDTDFNNFPTILLTTPVSSAASSSSSSVSSFASSRDFIIENMEQHNTAWSDTSSIISDAEKKNEKIEPEKKKKGRPRKEDAKNVKDAKKEKPKASKKPEMSPALTENEELDFGITIDQINEHVNVTMTVDE
jgi:hypothetical protein